MGIQRQMCCSDSSGGEVAGVVHVAVFICRRVAHAWRGDETSFTWRHKPASGQDLNQRIQQIATWLRGALLDARAATYSPLPNSQIRACGDPVG